MSHFFSGKTCSKINQLGLVIGLSALVFGCGGHSSSSSSSSGLLPLVTPIVKTAIPSGLGGSGGASRMTRHLGRASLGRFTNLP